MDLDEVDVDKEEEVVVGVVTFDVLMLGLIIGEESDDDDDNDCCFC
jgi:hypothetical protein